MFVTIALTLWFGFLIHMGVVAHMKANRNSNHNAGTTKKERENE